MPKSRPSRARQRKDDIDVSYEIDRVFGDGASKINLIEEDDEVEIIISDIPAPPRYNDSGQDEDGTKKYAVANWILDDAGKILEKYGEWHSSNHKSRQRYRYLRDVYFTCDRDELDEAVMDSKRFLSSLEEKVFHQHRHFDISLSETPSDDLNSK